MHLTRREKQIIQFLAKGLGYKQIAAELGISWETVKTIASAMIRKTGATNRTHLLSIIVGEYNINLALKEW